VANADIAGRPLIDAERVHPAAGVDDQQPFIGLVPAHRAQVLFGFEVHFGTRERPKS